MYVGNLQRYGEMEVVRIENLIVTDSDHYGLKVNNFNNLQIINCTLADNGWHDLCLLGVSSWLEGNVEIYNTIAWKNGEGAVIAVRDDLHASFFNCDLDGGINGIEADSIANLFFDACFDLYPGLDPTYRLLPSSSCIDRGTTVVPLPETDIDGEPRIQGGIVDVGADERN